MMTISSEAGERLAKAKARVNELNKIKADAQPSAGRDFNAALGEYCMAADAVAEELIASGFHDLEGA